MIAAKVIPLDGHIYMVGEEFNYPGMIQKNTFGIKVTIPKKNNFLLFRNSVKLLPKNYRLCFLKYLERGLIKWWFKFEYGLVL